MESQGRRLYVVGRLTKSKRVDWILRAAHSAGLGLPIVIVGDGPERSSLEGLAHDLGLTVTFAGFMRNPWSMLGAEDCIISASSFEGEPLTILEALQHRLPLLVSRITAHENLLGNHSGYFGSVSELSGILEDFKKLHTFEQGIVSPRTAAKALLGRQPAEVALQWTEQYRSLLNAGGQIS
ncbi:glycosyltransferase [Arthrobacter sp. ERGS1:01]|uniref:glycosyltransferase n=1 Tax=Arthrobacter sp. ERGS1:01 TaxID=1704044 RepID=UPI001364BFCD